MQNKEWNNDFVPYSLFKKNDVILERQLRKLHVSMRTAEVVTRIIIIIFIRTRKVKKYKYTKCAIK